MTMPAAALVAACMLLAPGAILAGAEDPSPDHFPLGELTAHAAMISPRPPPGFTIRIEQPFVVIGDEPAAMVRDHATRIVRWASDRLRQEYFAKDPDRIYDIWLFKDKESYDSQAPSLFGAPPISPYGYCSSAQHALVMNIATGGGTLVHEMTHAFMRGNFPACPTWFNEGLASLYEQCEERHGRIAGGINWRLPGLQTALRAGSAPAFALLTSLPAADYYGINTGVNYGVARYLCYYLQEKGLLQRFYRDVVAHQEEDPSGYRTLQAVLGNPDMAAFRMEWEAYVLALAMPAAGRRMPGWARIRVQRRN